MTDENKAIKEVLEKSWKPKVSPESVGNSVVPAAIAQLG